MCHSEKDKSWVIYKEKNWLHTCLEDPVPNFLVSGNGWTWLTINLLLTDGSFAWLIKKSGRHYKISLMLLFHALNSCDSNLSALADLPTTPLLRTSVATFITDLSVLNIFLQHIGVLGSFLTLIFLRVNVS